MAFSARPEPPAARSEAGQASVELVAAVPFVLLAFAIAWQLALVGETAWLGANAARAAARAEAVGRDGAAAARAALPRSLERGLKVTRATGGAIHVAVRVPMLLGRWRSPVSIGASAKLPGATP